jgi:anti-anti-sigma factor
MKAQENIMPGSNRVSTEGDTRTFHIDGKFDFKLNRAFREMYQQAPDDVRCFVIDLSRTHYMDSSALGMLLLLREHVHEDRSRVRIVRCNHEIRKILEIANFDKLFEIS